MSKLSIVVLILVVTVRSNTFPIVDWIRDISENINFEGFDNYLPIGDLAKYEYSLKQDVEEKTDIPSTTETINYVGEIITKKMVDQPQKNVRSGSMDEHTSGSDTENMKSLANKIGTTIATLLLSENTNRNKTSTMSPTRNFENAKRLEEILEFLRAHNTSDSIALSSATKLGESMTESSNDAQKFESTSIFIEEVSVTPATNNGDFTQPPTSTSAMTLRNSSRNIDPVDVANMSEINMGTSVRPIRQDGDGARGTTDATEQDDEEFAGRQSEESEEDMNQLTGLLSAFLGGLSRPDGSIDVEAITGLLGSLSTQNPDGSYDFNGLTDLLMSFFGGGGDEGGGSDVGAFLGGLLGAFIKGVAMPPGAKGAGAFAGKVLTGILPALSGPAPTEEGSTDKPAPPLDSGGFIAGLLSSILQGFGQMSNSSGGDNTGGGKGSKFPIFKAIFSMITSVFTSSSAPH